MLEITSIKNGLVIDHIEAGMGVKIFNYLHLDKTDYRVALIINAESKNLGKKDIIKIEKNNKIEQKNPMDYIQFLQWRKNYVKEKPNHSKFMDTWRSV